MILKNKCRFLINYSLVSVRVNEDLVNADTTINEVMNYLPRVLLK